MRLRGLFNANKSGLHARVWAFWRGFHPVRVGGSPASDYQVKAVSVVKLNQLPTTWATGLPPDPNPRKEQLPWLSTPNLMALRRQKPEELLGLVGADPLTNAAHTSC